MSPHAYKNLDVFVEQIPLRAGYAAVGAGAICLLLACLSITYAVLQANNVMTLRADILKAEALKPTVPVINKVPVADTDAQAFAKRLKDFYPQLEVNSSGARIEMRSGQIDKYGAFREAVGNVFNGGKGWRITVESMCVGRECKNNTPIFGAFTIHTLRVDKPAS
ncbi:MAG: hypothetical protein KGQ41_09515 [Alphaproteobacteria bacterium]|nr:hypothetical protein [Alphaproteobacteria bacterium]